MAAQDNPCVIFQQKNTKKNHLTYKENVNIKHIHRTNIVFILDRTDMGVGD